MENTRKDLMAVTGMLQHILEEFRAHRFSFTEQKITFSAGVAQYVPGLTADAFFEQADQTLYQAKRAGKNRILQAKKRPLQDNKKSIEAYCFDAFYFVRLLPLCSLAYAYTLPGLPW